MAADRWLLEGAQRAVELLGVTAPVGVELTDHGTAPGPSLLVVVHGRRTTGATTSSTVTSTGTPTRGATAPRTRSVVVASDSP